jgi:hypothetical protein
VVGGEIRDSIEKTVQEEFLAKVDRDMCYKTKYNALNELVDTGWVVVHADRGGLSRECQFRVPSTVIDAMLKIGAK